MFYALSMTSACPQSYNTNKPNTDAQIPNLSAPTLKLYTLTPGYPVATDREPQNARNHCVARVTHRAVPHTHTHTHTHAHPFHTSNTNQCPQTLKANPCPCARERVWARTLFYFASLGFDHRTDCLPGARLAL